MILYDSCRICGKWDDLVEWRKVIYVCTECSDKLLARALVTNESKKRKTQYILQRITLEVRRGKTSA